MRTFRYDFVNPGPQRTRLLWSQGSGASSKLGAALAKSGPLNFWSKKVFFYFLPIGKWFRTNISITVSGCSPIPLFCVVQTWLKFRTFHVSQMSDNNPLSDRSHLTYTTESKVKQLVKRK